MERYYLIHNPVGRFAPRGEQISLVKILEGELTPLRLSVISRKFNEKNFEFDGNKIKMIGTTLAPYCKIEEVRRETFESLQEYFD